MMSVSVSILSRSQPRMRLFHVLGAIPTSTFKRDRCLAINPENVRLSFTTNSQAGGRNSSAISSHFILLSMVLVSIADVLCFDNSYSKFRSKTLYYVTQIVHPAKNNDSD